MYNDVIRYSGIDFPKSYLNKNLAYAIECVAYKYGITYKIGNQKKPKMKQTKLFIVNKCLEYFNVEISLKQISYLLRPQFKCFPYTAIIIIETIYNLLKEERWGEGWKKGLEEYILFQMQGNYKYEKFMLNDLSENIAGKVDDFMNSEYKEIYRCFIDSREIYNSKIDDISIIEHCEKNFPSNCFIEDDIPKSVYDYQNKRVYMKERKNGTLNKKYK